jgi:hypothetical protein
VQRARQVAILLSGVTQAWPAARPAYQSCPTFVVRRVQRARQVAASPSGVMQGVARSTAGVTQAALDSVGQMVARQQSVQSFMRSNQGARHHRAAWFRAVLCCAPAVHR